MLKHCKKILVFLIITILFVGFFAIKETKAGAEHNVYGWAWAGPTIGWVSFNCLNDYNNDGTRDDQCSGINPDTGLDYINYGVNIDPATGVLSGYAWMGSTDPSFGWISFEPADLVGCPSGTCQAIFDLDTLEISGWARALSLDGWIKLKGIAQNGSPYGVTLNPAPPTPAEFEGWAWSDGGSVLGWISFNCSNSGTCLTVDYKVMTGLSVNSAPTAAISCEDCVNNPLVPCEAYQGEGLCLINKSSDPDGEGDIFQSIWYIDSDEITSCSGKCNFTPQNWVGIGSYTAGLKVEDTATQSSTATPQPFKIKRDITADFMCSLDNSTWQICEDISPANGDTVYFEDNSLASEGAAINSREWEKDTVAFDSGNNTNSSVTATIPSMAIGLTVIDTAGRTASKTHTIGVRMPLPTWKEIPPF